MPEIIEFGMGFEPRPARERKTGGTSPTHPPVFLRKNILRILSLVLLGYKRQIVSIVVGRVCLPIPINRGKGAVAGPKSDDLKTVI